MIISPATPPPWDSENAVVLKEFLSTSTGMRLQDVVAFNCLPFLDGSDVNATLVRSGYRQGYEDSFSFFRSLVSFQPEQPEQSDNYPNLDDESKWPQTTK